MSSSPSTTSKRTKYDSSKPIPELISQFRTGYSYLITCNQFKNIFNNIWNNNTLLVNNNNAIHNFINNNIDDDLSIDLKDFIIQTPEDTVNTYINEKIKQTNEYLVSPDNNTKYNKLEEIPINVLHDIIIKLKLLDNIPNPEDINEKLTQIKKLRRVAKAKIVCSRVENNNAITAEMIQAKLDIIPEFPTISDEVILEVSIFHPTSYIKNIGLNLLSSNTLLNLATIIIENCNEKHICTYFLIERIAFCDENLLFNFEYEVKSLNECNNISHIPFRLGSHYLMKHGNCSHVFCFSNMRMLNNTADMLREKAYPLLIYKSKLKVRFCSACNLLPAKKVTINDELATESPCFFCDNCFTLLHLDSNGQPLYSGMTVYDCDNFSI